MSASRPSDHGGSRTSGASEKTFPSISSQARYDSSYRGASSLYPNGRGSPASPTNITSLVSSLRSDGTYDWHDALPIHSPFGAVPRGLSNVTSDVTSSPDSGNTLPGGLHAQQRALAASTSGASDRSISTAVDGIHSADKGSSQVRVEESDDGKI